MKKNILISCPNIYNQFIYLPLAWGILKTYAEKDEKTRESYNWLEPLYLNESPEDLVSVDQAQSVDVLGLSCYVWNFGLNIRIAEYVKRLNPNALIVLGGPHPDWDNPEKIFTQFPFVDLIVKNEGEYTFAEILRERLEEKPNFKNVLGVFTQKHGFTGERELERKFEGSPYLSQEDMYKKIIADVKGRSGKVFMLHETDRGCMYGCVFCNWGSATMTKLRRIPLDRCEQEIDWAGRNRVDAIENTNANFGQLETDFELSKLVVETNKKYGYPNDFWYSSSKSQPRRVFEIARLLKQNDLLDFQVLALQTTDQQIMRNSKRTNLRPDRIEEFVKNCRSENIPIKVQLIRGLPGETLKTWYQSIEDCLHYGVVEGFQQFPWEVLPNSPAAKQSYLDKWKIGTVSRFPHIPRRKRSIELDSISTNRIVVETESYSRSEYVDMWVASIFVQVFFSQGFLRYFLIFLNKEKGFQYQNLFQLIICDLLKCLEYKNISYEFRQIIEELEDYVNSDIPANQALLEKPFSHLSGYEPMLTVEERLTFWLAKNLDDWFSEFSQFATQRFDFKELQDLLRFQKSMIIDFNYSPKQGRRVELDYDWVAYFSEIDDDPEANIKLLEVSNLIQLSQMATGSRGQYNLEWHSQETEDGKKRSFLEAITGSVYTSTGRNLFRLDQILVELRESHDISKDLY